MLNRIAAVGRRFAGGLRGTIGQLSWAYLLMMVSAGLTIGAIAGLSNTSVTNTLLELIVPFAAGSAGIYFLNRETLRKEAKALPVIGVVGVGFFAAFWAAFLPASWYRHHAAGHHEWDAALSPEENFTRAELLAHAHSLGMSRRAVADALAAAAAKGLSTSPCAFLSNEPRTLIQDVNQVYAHVAKNGRLDGQVRHVASYLEKRFEKLPADLMSSDDRVRNGAADAFDAAIATLLYLSREHREIAWPSTAFCLPEDSSQGACLVVQRLEERLNACANSISAQMLLAARAHARSFESIWNRSMPPASPRNTLESNP